MLRFQLGTCLEGREKGKHWGALKENLPNVSFFGGARGRWLAHVKFYILGVKTTSNQYSLGSEE